MADEDFLDFPTMSGEVFDNVMASADTHDESVELEELAKLPRLIGR